MESPRQGLVLKPSRQPRSLASHRGRGSWVITAYFPRPQLGRDRVKRFSSALFPLGRRSCGRALRSSFPSPIRPGDGGEAQRGGNPSPTWTGEVGKRPDSKDGPRGRVEVAAPAARLSRLAVRRRRSERPAQPPPSPAASTRRGRPAAQAAKQPSSYCDNFSFPPRPAG